MQPVLPLEQMTREEKLRIMEELWTDLSRNESQFESPAWHADVLRERSEAVASGKETFIDWEDVKKQLRNRKK
jgi:putative addiction module component (TIGR02574 family)